MLGYVGPDDWPKVQRVVDRRRDMQNANSSHHSFVRFERYNISTSMTKITRDMETCFDVTCIK